MDIRALRDGRFGFCSGDGTVGVLGANGSVVWQAAPGQLQFGKPSALRISQDGNSIETDAFWFTGTGWKRASLFFSLADRILEKNGTSHPSFQSALTSGLPVGEWEGKYSPTLGGRRLQLPALDVSRSLAISPAAESFVLGTDCCILRFDRNGTELWKTPLPGAASAVNISADKRLVVAALTDGTIRWYTFDSGREILALFVDHLVSRWVAWNPDGFFDFHGGGDALIGYQLDKGSGEASDFIKVDQLRDVFYRSDLISRILKPGGPEAVLAAKSKIGDLSALLSGGLLPEIELISEAYSKVRAREEYVLTVQIKDRGAGHGRVVYHIDDVEVAGREVGITLPGSTVVNRRFDLAAGRHKITATVYNSTNQNQITLGFDDRGC